MLCCVDVSMASTLLSQPLGCTISWLEPHSPCVLKGEVGEGVVLGRLLPSSDTFFAAKAT